MTKRQLRLLEHKDNSTLIVSALLPFLRGFYGPDVRFDIRNHPSRCDTDHVLVYIDIHKREGGSDYA